MAPRPNNGEPRKKKMMTDMNDALRDLLELSHKLGDPAHGWALLGEGNTSIRRDTDSFYVKASGSQLQTLTPEQVSTVRFAPILEALTDGTAYNDDQVTALLRSSLVEDNGRLPSTETLMHAYLLSLPGIGCIGHTHITSVNGLMCSVRGWEAVSGGGRLFPDEIVVCGPAPCCVAYVDPGIPLARAIREAVEVYRTGYGVAPKTIYLQNHGFIAVGRSAAEVHAITLMADKAAKVLASALCIGEPSFLTPANVDRIYTWPAEHYRQKALGLQVDG